MYKVHNSKRMLITIMLLAVVIASGFAFSHEESMEAVDTFGRRILLREDYTWKYAQPDVPNLYWGMSMEQVRMIENMRFIPIDDNTLMAMNVSAFNMSGMLILGFDDDRLEGTIYLFDEHHSNGDLYIKDYQTMVKHFISLYGQPNDEIIEWVGEETEAIGEAYFNGVVEMATRWETERSNIMCGLANDDDLFGLLVVYSDIKSEDFSF